MIDMKYKIYIVKTDACTSATTFIESDFDWVNTFDTMEEAIKTIEREGNDYVQYTILPYIYLGL